MHFRVKYFSWLNLVFKSIRFPLRMSLPCKYFNIFVSPCSSSLTAILTFIINWEAEEIHALEDIAILSFYKCKVHVSTIDFRSIVQDSGGFRFYFLRSNMESQSQFSPQYSYGILWDQAIIFLFFLFFCFWECHKTKIVMILHSLLLPVSDKRRKFKGAEKHSNQM